MLPVRALHGAVAQLVSSSGINSSSSSSSEPRHGTGRQGPPSQSSCSSSSSLSLPLPVSRCWNEDHHTAARTRASACLRYPTASLATLLALSSLAGLLYLWPFPTTIHIMLSLVVGLAVWTSMQWLSLARHAACGSAAWHRSRHIREVEYESSLPLLSSNDVYRGDSTNPSESEPSFKHNSHGIPPQWTYARRIAIIAASLLLTAILLNAFPLSEKDTPLPALIPSEPGVPEKYFIAAGLYNNEELIPFWSAELLKLCQHLGEKNVFISIAESNSIDGTVQLLSDLDRLLTAHNISHRITTEHNPNRQWPYPASPERITYLAEVRNKALEPLQSNVSSIRLLEASSFTKILFFNDIYFSWQSIVRLLATRLDSRDDLPPDYDLACAFDYGFSGLYDTWVTRDVCGSPMRSFWPYAKDRQSVDRIKAEMPFEVAACWNGAVAFPAGPHVWKEVGMGGNDDKKKSDAPPHMSPRGWRMMDNATYDHTLYSPPVPSPVKFRGPSYKDACDHSEAFLWSYDIHRRLQGERRPRIYMNPAVKVAYDLSWYRWNTVVLQMPFVRLWRKIWSHGPPFLLVDWIYEKAGRQADYCTWARFQVPERCPPLARPAFRGWQAG